VRSMIGVAEKKIGSNEKTLFPMLIVTARRNHTMRFFPYNKHFSAHCIYLFVSHICRDEIAQSQIPCAFMIIPYLGKLYKLFVCKKPAVYLPTFLLYSFCRFRSEFCYYRDCSVFMNLYTLHNPTNYDVIIISK